MRTMNQKGISMIELVIVLGIIAVVGAGSALALNTARARARDAVRISNVRQIQAALELAFNESNMYPAGEVLPLGEAGVTSCLDEGGFAGSCGASGQVFLRAVPGTIATGLDGLSSCGTPAHDAFCYLQTQGGASYRMQFELERALDEVGLAAGLNCASPEGVTGGACR